MSKINTTAFAVERYIALPGKEDTPQSGAGRPTLYPFNLMVRGDSFQVPANLDTKLRNAARMYANKHGVTFEYQESNIGTRVWRTK